MNENLQKLTTEKRNERSTHLDKMSVQEILSLMNEEDYNVLKAIKEQEENIVKIVDAAIKQFKAGGRLIYVGAGTSGRLAVVDAAECIPTFNTKKGEVVAVMAGGETAFTVPVEKAEDSEELAMNDLEKLKLNTNDIVIGIAASGRTPYVIGALKYANKCGSISGSISCNKGTVISNIAQIGIEVDCGPEVLTGSTRLKAGTAQKLILNMISTTTMIKIGKVYENLMVDVLQSNAKLIDRAKRIVLEATKADKELVDEVFTKSKSDIKIAIVMILKNLDYDNAKSKLSNVNGVISEII